VSAEILAQVGTVPVGHGFAPHWGWYIVLYFFFGGLCAGAYFIATLLMLVGDPRDRETIRLGYLISFPLLLICAVLLILDLGVPLRFWHMLFQSENVPELVLKPWSPISLGTWILSIFGLFSFVAFVGALLDSGRLRWRPALRAAAWAGTLPRRAITAWNVVGSAFGFALAGYTGVLVTATTIPAWQNARLLGGLFLASAASASYALLVLLLLRRGRNHSDPAVSKLARADRYVMVLEVLLVLALVITLGAASRPMTTGGFGVLFWLGAIGLGILVPLLLQRVPAYGRDPHRREVIAAVCVLIGGLILRFVVVMAPQYPAVPLWAL
jgi:formate-dependent nitrite reductase membrane component NrfD